MSRLPELARRPTGAAEVIFDSASLRQAICDSAQRDCTEAFRNQLRALISTGSLARDEASFLRKENSWAVCGDAEFVVVLEKSATLPTTAALDEIRRRIESNLLQQNIQCKIDLSAVHPSYFQRLPAHIFTYELKHCGQVVWGDDRILRLIPDWPVDDLSLQDAWRLLCNRMIEMLECAAEMSSDEKPPSATLHYKIVKLYLDMATSFLVFVRAYAPTYQERQKILRRLAKERTQAGEYPFELGTFADRVDDCTEQKLSSQARNKYLLDSSWRDALDTAHMLWRWELHRLTGANSVLSDSELMDEMIRLQPFTARVRGWMYVLRARGWYMSYRHWLRWLRLGCRASPRYCVYAAACSLLFHPDFDSALRPTGRKENRGWDNPSGWLPVIDHTKVDGNMPDWLKTASAAVSNYREFVVGTRA